jgi:outer membrane biogenesis lipoprotein LolB
MRRTATLVLALLAVISLVLSACAAPAATPHANNGQRCRLQWTKEHMLRLVG